MNILPSKYIHEVLSSTIRKKNHRSNNDAKTFVIRNDFVLKNARASDAESFF